jgi:hypothetical protein
VCFSVKDRAALYIIKDAEERGILVPGKPGLIVEGTAGNTGQSTTAYIYIYTLCNISTQHKRTHKGILTCHVVLISCLSMSLLLLHPPSPNFQSLSFIHLFTGIGLTAVGNARGYKTIM